MHHPTYSLLRPLLFLGIILTLSCRDNPTVNSYRTDLPDMQLIRLLRDSITENSNSNPHVAIAASKTLLQEVRHSDRIDLAAEAYNDLASLTRLIRKFDETRLYVDTLYQLAAQTGSDTVLRMAYIIAGDLYRDLGELDSSAGFLVKALKIPQPLNSVEKKRLYYGLAKTALQQRKYKLAMQYYQPLIQFARDTPDYPGAIRILSNAYSYAQDIDTNARFFLYEALDMSFRKKDSSLLCGIYTNLADAFLTANKPDSAEYFARKAIVIGEKLQLPIYKTEQSYLGLLLVLTIRQKFDEAAALLHKIENTVDTQQLNIEDQFGFSYVKSSIYKSQHRDKDAIKELEKALKLQEQQLKNINNDVIQNYEKELKHLGAEKTINQQHEEISRQRTSNALLLALLLVSLMAASLLLYYRFREKKLDQQRLLQLKKEKELENQEKLLDERRRISREMHDDLGSTLTATLMAVQLVKEGHTDDWTLSIIEESANKLHAQINEIIWNLNTQNDTVRNLSSFIISFAKKFITTSGITFEWTESISVPDYKIDGYQRRNIYLCTKEVFNNLVKHAQASHCTLTVQADKEALFIQILDNGIGIDTAAATKHEDRPHYGLDNLKRRMEQIGGIIKWRNATAGGTIVDISFPLHPHH